VVLLQLISSKWRSQRHRSCSCLDASRSAIAAAAASADTDEDGRVCVGGLGPCPLLRAGLLLKATSEHGERPAAVHQMHAPRAARSS